ncbi:uncharacterized protein LOC131160339 isoform X2 [Malania oleifera]|uniref:uncharacterized protein LOC131160339 isoform X2 n=1 Tax=Malania oleifera TaxID=397392 RepID=UPI0025AE7860|nr:uncharacterized protein LOC131160339 isoform X2 [Malania oleifera]
MAAYYPPPTGLHASHYPYYQAPPPLPLGAAAPQPPVVGQPPQHLTQQYLPHQQPHFASYAAPPAPLHGQGFPGEVRTLFIAGLPEDVKPREIYSLFREFPGFESSHLRTPTETSQPFAFAVFVDQQSAITAMQALNGMVFDLEKGSTLYIDLAKSNSRSKRSRTTDDERSGFDKKIKASAAYSRGTPDSGVGSVHLPGMVNSAYNTIGYPSTQSHGSFEGLAGSETNTMKSNTFSTSHVPQSVTPCPTLFVANLGPTCTEQELTQVFSRCLGFLKLKMQSTYGSPVAFVDFQDTASSTEALNNLQGTILYSSPAGEGMRLEYAKSRMGMRRKAR